MYSLPQRNTRRVHPSSSIPFGKGQRHKQPHSPSAGPPSQTDVLLYQQLANRDKVDVPTNPNKLLNDVLHDGDYNELTPEDVPPINELKIDSKKTDDLTEGSVKMPPPRPFEDGTNSSTDDEDDFHDGDSEEDGYSSGDETGSEMEEDDAYFGGSRRSGPKSLGGGTNETLGHNRLFYVNQLRLFQKEGHDISVDLSDPNTPLSLLKTEYDLVQENIYLEGNVKWIRELVIIVTALIELFFCNVLGIRAFQNWSSSIKEGDPHRFDNDIRNISLQYCRQSANQNPLWSLSKNVGFHGLSYVANNQVKQSASEGFGGGMLKGLIDKFMNKKTDPSPAPAPAASSGPPPSMHNIRPAGGASKNVQVTPFSTQQGPTSAGAHLRKGPAIIRPPSYSKPPTKAATPQGTNMNANTPIPHF